MNTDGTNILHALFFTIFTNYLKFFEGPDYQSPYLFTSGVYNLILTAYLTF